MTEQEHYSLRWNNHQNHILRAFDALLQTKSLVDVTLVCAETSIRAHKVVLSACSPFFQNVFAENPCKHPVIVLKDFPGWVVQAVVDFMYRGEISVPQKRLETLIQVGESLQIRGLVEHRIASKDLTLSLDEPDDDYLDPPLLSNESTEHYDDATTIVKSASIATAQNPRHLNSNKFTDISAASTANTSTPKSISTTFSSTTVQQQALTTTNNNHNNHQTNENRETNCTSPMPRRKQARPRRRSGEGGPHGYSSKSVSPLPIAHENNSSETDIRKEHIGNSSNSSSSSANEHRKFESLGHPANLDIDKAVDCSVAAMEASITSDKLNANDDYLTDNELDDDEGLCIIFYKFIYLL